MIRFDDQCRACGANEFRPLAVRSDGIPVIVCTTCGHGVVEYFQDDPQALYGDDYFAAAPDSTSGYTDYDYTAQHALTWASTLVRLLRPSGRILDIGCASGHLLKDLGDAYERFGIEPNRGMADKCQLAGGTIIASDLLDACVQRYAGSFDLATAIAVFEHVPDFKGAFEAALSLLRPDGLLLFEVPVISGPANSDVWFRTSLEHIHYPTEKSLQYLLGNVLGFELVGSTVLIQGFGSIYIGITSKSSAVIDELRPRFERLFHASPGSLTREEARFRWFLDLIHAANARTDVLALSEHIDGTDLNPLLIRRLIEVWSMQVARAASIEQYLGDVEKARDWHAEEVRKREELIAVLQQENEVTKRYAESLARNVTAAQEEIASLQRMIAEERHRAEQLGAIITEVRQCADERGREAERLTQLMPHLENAIAVAEERIRDLEQSWSWKLTRPLRWLGRRNGNR